MRSPHILFSSRTNDDEMNLLEDPIRGISSSRLHKILNAIEEVLLLCEEGESEEVAIC